MVIVVSASGSSEEVDEGNGGEGEKAPTPVLKGSGEVVEDVLGPDLRDWCWDVMDKALFQSVTTLNSLKYRITLGYRDRRVRNAAFSAARRHLAPLLISLNPATRNEHQLSPDIPRALIQLMSALLVFATTRTISGAMMSPLVPTLYPSTACLLASTAVWLLLRKGTHRQLMGPSPFLSLLTASGLGGLVFGSLSLWPQVSSLFLIPVSYLVAYLGSPKVGQGWAGLAGCVISGLLWALTNMSPWAVAEAVVGVLLFHGGWAASAEDPFLLLTILLHHQAVFKALFKAHPELL